MRETKNNIGVAIQGGLGSFHHEAAVKFYGDDIDMDCHTTFASLIQATKTTGKVDTIVMAIENSIAGSILPNYNLLHQSTLTVVGEVYLQIHQHLLVNKNISLNDIQEVHSHTMALQQCTTYLDQQQWKLVETNDTALSAKYIKDHQSKHIAAIASAWAAKIYDLEIAAANIQTLTNNYTRFLVLNEREQNLNQPIKNADKASIQFATASLSNLELVKILQVFEKFNIKLSKLQSFPSYQAPFTYQYHADVEFEHIESFYKAINKIEQQTQTLKIYGIYKKGNASIT